MTFLERRVKRKLSSVPFLSRVKCSGNGILKEFCDPPFLVLKQRAQAKPHGSLTLKSRQSRVCNPQLVTVWNHHGVMSVINPKENTRWRVMPYACGDYILTCGEITYQSFGLDRKKQVKRLAFFWCGKCRSSRKRLIIVFRAKSEAEAELCPVSIQGKVLGKRDLEVKMPMASYSYFT